MAKRLCVVCMERPIDDVFKGLCNSCRQNIPGRAFYEDIANIAKRARMFERRRQRKAMRGVRVNWAGGRR